MIISIVNHTKGKVTDEALQAAIRAINRQIAEDFEPYWSMGATLRLEGRSAAQPDSAQAADMRGDAVIYLWDEADVEGAIGYHFQNNRGIPFGFVFTSVAERLGEDWSVTLSHETLELLGDPETNLLVIGPHPDPSQDREVFFWFEMCDAVQAETYEVDHVKVSNFLLPLYFTGTRDTDEPGARNDFLGRAYKGQTLRSFGLNPGGYVGFFDPETGQSETYSLRGDDAARQRYEIQQETKEAWRATRCGNPDVRGKLQRKGSAGRRAAAAAPRPAPAVASLTGETAAVASSGPSRLGSTKRPMTAKGPAGGKGQAFLKGPAGAKRLLLAKGPAGAKRLLLAKGLADAKRPLLAKGQGGSRRSGTGSSHGGQGRLR